MIFSKSVLIAVLFTSVSWLVSAAPMNPEIVGNTAQRVAKILEQYGSPAERGSAPGFRSIAESRMPSLYDANDDRD
jgi:hypothetical protein